MPNVKIVKRPAYDHLGRPDGTVTVHLVEIPRTKDTSKWQAVVALVLFLITVIGFAILLATVLPTLPNY